MSKPILAAVAAVLLLAQGASAQAQTAAATSRPEAAAKMAQQPDPRVAGPTIRAQSALIELREAELRALAQDSDKRIKELEAKLKAATEAARPADPAPAEPPKE
jgi:hypothetical protein